MSTTRIEEHIYMVDVEAAGIRNFVASYILMGEKTIIVETGPASSVQNLIRGLMALNVKPGEVAYVAISHIHLDHGGGVGPLLRLCPKAKVIVHPRGASHLASPEKLWQQSQLALGPIAEIYGKPEPVPPDRIVAAEDGMTLDAGNGVALRVVETLGHASHHLSYCEPLSNGVFPGDAAGIYLNEIGVIVPTTPSPFRLDITLSSLKKLSSLKPSALYYTHFGKADNAMEKLEAYAKQLKLWANIAKEALDKGESPETLGWKIAERDEAVKKALEYIRTHRIYSKTVLGESVRGVFDYVKNFGVVPA
jgi:glyoxylase-like metal-dependent hydrolase (beta-lactamase superfamily II)